MEPGGKQIRKMPRKRKWWKDFDLYLMLCPMMLLILVFSYKPDRPRAAGIYGHSQDRI